MTNTYTWFIDSLDCIPSIEGQTFNGKVTVIY